MTRGYFFIAMGNQYIDEAVRLTNTLRKCGDTYPVSILCTESDITYADSFNLFDKVIVFDFDNEFSKLDKTPFEKYGGTPKILMMDYVPYDETIYTDTDVLVQVNPKNLWEYLSTLNQPCAVMGAKISKDDMFMQNVAKKLNIESDQMYYIHSGIVFIKKTHKDFDEFSTKLKYFWKNYYENGLGEYLFRSGKADEHAIMAVYNIMQLEVIDGGKIPTMTHNYHCDIDLPSHIITGGNMGQIQCMASSPPPFIHMFKSYDRKHYDTLYTRLMNNPS